MATITPKLAGKKHTIYALDSSSFLIDAKKSGFVPQANGDTTISLRGDTLKISYVTDTVDGERGTGDAAQPTRQTRYRSIEVELDEMPASVRGKFRQTQKLFNKAAKGDPAAAEQIDALAEYWMNLAQREVKKEPARQRQEERDIVRASKRQREARKPPTQPAVAPTPAADTAPAIDITTVLNQNSAMGVGHVRDGDVTINLFGPYEASNGEAASILIDRNNNGILDNADLYIEVEGDQVRVNNEHLPVNAGVANDPQLAQAVRDIAAMKGKYADGRMFTLKDAESIERQIIEKATALPPGVGL